MFYQDIQGTWYFLPNQHDVVNTVEQDVLWDNSDQSPYKLD